MEFSSKLIEDAVQAFTQLPGIGKKTALRMVLHLLKEDESKSIYFGEAIINMRKNIKFCHQCNNVADDVLCSICKDPHRNENLICVVENIRDIISIESTQQYKGLYHVIGGLLSPLDGIGPEQLHIESLIQRIKSDTAQELIMAVSPTIEGDTTVFYLCKQLHEFPQLIITSIARGIAFGGEIEYTDEITLARSITQRLPVRQYINT